MHDQVAVLPNFAQKQIFVVEPCISHHMHAVALFESLLHRQDVWDSVIGQALA